MGHSILEEAAGLAEAELCPKLQWLIERPAFKHQFNLAVTGNQLLLAVPNSAERLMLAGLSGQRIGFTHCVADGENQLTFDWDLVFLVVEEYLQPVELVHSLETGRRYRQATGEGSVDASEVDLAHFSEYIADMLERQRWIQDSCRIE